ASIFAESDHIAHVNTQIPYALVPASIAGILYLSYSIVGSSVILLIIGIIIQFLLLGYLVSRHERKYNPINARIGAWRQIKVVRNEEENNETFQYCSHTWRRDRP